MTGPRVSTAGGDNDDRHSAPMGNVQKSRVAPRCSDGGKQKFPQKVVRGHLELRVPPLEEGVVARHVSVLPSVSMHFERDAARQSAAVTQEAGERAGTAPDRTRNICSHY